MENKPPKMNENIKIFLAANNENAVILTGYDAAIIGTYQREVLVYSFNAIIEILCNDMSRTDAIGFFYFNIEPAAAEFWPIFIETQDK